MVYHFSQRRKAIEKDRQGLRSDWSLRLMGIYLQGFGSRIVGLVKLSDSGKQVEESLNSRTIHSSPPKFGILSSDFRMPEV